MNCEIICIGTELLTGDTLNTNVCWLSQELSLRGFSVHYHTTIGDNPERLAEILDSAVRRSEIVFFTGGLGPTQDDLTKQTVAAYFKMPLVRDDEEVAHLTQYFEKRHMPMTENNLRQADIPFGAEKLINPQGSAPGIYIKKDGVRVFMLPGPPHEMKAMFTNQVLPVLNTLMDQKVLSRYYNLGGIGESMVEDALMDLVEEQTNPTIATYAKTGEVLVRVTASGFCEKKINNLLDQYEAVIRERLGQHIFTMSKDTYPVAMAKLLIEKGLTIATAESCTGGLIASKLAEVPGISASLQMGLVTYSNEAKMQLLGVSSDTLLQFGSVSEETCREMADGLYRVSGCDVCVSVTGIAGPGGGTPEKPVGLVYIGVRYQNKTSVYECHFTHNGQGSAERTVIQTRVLNAALNFIRMRLFDIEDANRFH